MGKWPTKFRLSRVLGSVLLCLLILIPETLLAASVAYTYDAVGRLLAAQYDNGQSLTYTYDSVGNRTGQVVIGTGISAQIVPVILLLIGDSTLNNPVASILNQQGSD